MEDRNAGPVLPNETLDLGGRSMLPHARTHGGDTPVNAVAEGQVRRGDNKPGYFEFGIRCAFGMSASRRPRNSGLTS